MNIETKVKMAIAHAGISVSELARRIGQTPQNLSQKLKRGSLTTAEKEQIAAALGGEWREEIVFQDGTVI